MKKVSLTLPQKSWGSLNTKFPANTINVDVDELTEGSKNFDTDTKGALVKRKGGVNFNDVLFAGTPVDLFEAVFSSGVHHLLIGTSTGILRASEGSAAIVAADMTQSSLASFSTTGNLEFALYLDRVYMGNGINAPQVYDRTQVYGGINYGVPVSAGFVSDAGATPPTSAPGFAADSSGGSVPDGDHTYKVTFLYYGFEESNGGPATVSHTVASPNNTINLTSIPIGGYGVTARKVYRDDADGVYRLVGTVGDNTTTVFTDTFAVGTAFIPTDNGIPPLFSLIIQHKDRNWMAGVTGTPSTLYFTDAGKPDVVRSTSTILCNPEDPITALSVYNDRIIVFNRNSFGQILGTTSDTFRYSEFPGSIGCVDNRTIQVRTIRGVPVLVWLSDKGFYQFNGSSVDYISNKIENKVNLNIQQAAQVKGQNTQTSQSQFQAGVASPGIDLTSNPGNITMANPKRIWSSQDEWEAGTALNGISTNTTPGSIKNPIKFLADLASGVFNNLIESASKLTMVVGGDFTEETSSNFQGTYTEVTPPAGQEKIATSIIPTFTGTLGRIAIAAAHEFGSTTLVWTAFVALDSGGEPGTEIGTAPVTIDRTSATLQFSTSLGTTLNGGQKYWIGIRDNIVRKAVGGSVLSGGASLNFRDGSWTGIVSAVGNPFDVGASYEFTKTSVAKSGTWISAENDTGVKESIDFTGTFTLNKPFDSEPAGTTITWEVHSSDTTGFTPDASTLKASFSSGAGGGFAATLNRFIKIKIKMETGDDRIVPIADDPSLEFPISLSWESDNQEHTTDVTVYNEVVITADVPAGTSANVQIKTDDNAGFSSPTLSGTFALSTGINTISLTGVGVEAFLV